MIATFNRLTLPIMAAALYFSGFAGLLGTPEQIRLGVVALFLFGGIMAVVMMLAYGIHPRIKNVLIFGSIFLSVTFASLALGAPDGGIDWDSLTQTIIQLSLVFAWIIYCAHGEWDQPWFWHVLSVIGVAILGINLMMWVQAGFVPAYEGMATIKNALATAALIGCFAGLGSLNCGSGFLPKMLGSVTILVSLGVLFASGGRSSMIALAAGAFVYCTWSLMSSKTLHWFSFLILAIICVSIPSIYLNLENFSFFQKVQYFSRDVFSGNVYTGRESLWPTVMDGIREHPMYGHGSESDLRFNLYWNAASASVELSAHNLYLATLYHTGIVGLTGLILFCGAIWGMYHELHFSWQTRIAASFFVAILFRESFEVSLTQNNLQMGLGQWTLIACGISPWLDRLIYVSQGEEEIPEPLPDELQNEVEHLPNAEQLAT